MLPYTEITTVENLAATKTITVNPNKSAKFAGMMILEPNIDMERYL